VTDQSGLKLSYTIKPFQCENIMESQSNVIDSNVTVNLNSRY